MTAAAGGVGLSAVQIAKGCSIFFILHLVCQSYRIRKGLGAKVIAAAGSQSKLDIVKKYGGADYTIDYTKPGWQKEVLKITNGNGADVIYDPVVRTLPHAILIFGYDFNFQGHDHGLVSLAREKKKGALLI